jgi:hypothetical protein
VFVVTCRGFISVGLALAVSATACGGEETEDTAGSSATNEAPSGVVSQTDIPYASSDGTIHTLDVHLPGDPADAPIVIDTIQGFHRPVEVFAEQGLIAVVPQVRMRAPEEVVGDPAAMRATAEQFACAVHFARARAAAVGNENPHVVLTGFSRFGAAATHVALLGETFDDAWDEFAEAGGPPRQLECEADATTHVDALVSTGAPYALFVPVFDGHFQRDHDATMRQFLTQAISANPKLALHLLHGNEDIIDSPAEAAEFADVMADAGYDVQLTTFDGGHEHPPTELYVSTVSEALDE